MKLNISLPDKLAEQIEIYSKELFQTKSGFISSAVSEYILKIEMVKHVKDIYAVCDKLASNGGVDEETVQMINQLKLATRLFEQSFKE